MAEFDWQSRMKITEQRAKELKNRIRGLSGMEGQLALDLKDNRNAMLIMDEKIEDQREQVKFAEKHVEEARNRLQEVMKERKMHEKLREKAFVELVREENAAEHKAVDELTSYTYGQRSKIKGEQ